MSAPLRPWVGLALAVILSGALVVEAPGATVRRSVIGSGATTATGGGRVLLGTVGQPVVGAGAASAHAIAHGFWTVGALTTTAVDPRGGVPAPPSSIEFGAPSPNPSRGELAFDIGLPHAATVSLLVADVQGRAVAPAAPQPVAAGRHRLVFDPAGSAGIPAGIYFARLVVDGRAVGTHRFVRMR